MVTGGISSHQRHCPKGLIIWGGGGQKGIRSNVNKVCWTSHVTTDMGPCLILYEEHIQLYEYHYRVHG